MIVGLCSVCNKSAQLRVGMCIPHYAANWRKEMRKVPCKVDGCDKGVKCRMVCDTHFRKLRRYERAQEERARAEQERNSSEAIEAIKAEERQRITRLIEGLREQYNLSSTGMNEIELAKYEALCAATDLVKGST